MSDIVERLNGVFPDCEYYKAVIETQALKKEAAAEIERLRANLDELNYSAKLRWESDMRAIKLWQAAHPGNECTWPGNTDLCSWLMAERDALQARINEVVEIYAGMEGFIPQTAPEGYLQRVVKQMYDAAIDAATRMEHDLKTWPEPFNAVLSGRKSHEIRSTADRNFNVGDVLLLREFVPDDSRYTGRRVRVTVTHITAPGAFGLPENVCVMSISAAPQPPEAVAVAMVEQHGYEYPHFARVQWLLNPMPPGSLLYEQHVATQPPADVRRALAIAQAVEERSKAREFGGLVDEASAEIMQRAEEILRGEDEA